MIAHRSKPVGARWKPGPLVASLTLLTIAFVACRARGISPIRRGVPRWKRRPASSAIGVCGRQRRLRLARTLPAAGEAEETEAATELISLH